MMALRLSNLERTILEALFDRKEYWKRNNYRDHPPPGPKPPRSMWEGDGPYSDWVGPYTDKGEPYLDWDYWYGDSDDESKLLLGKRYWSSDRPDWYVDSEPHEDAYSNWGYSDNGRINIDYINTRKYITLGEILEKLFK